MLAAVYYNNNDVRIQEMPIPQIGNHELLLKVMACGICGSDVTEWYRVPRAPKVLGHEATGIVDQVGSEVKDYKIGDRVFVSHHVPCSNCRYCNRGQHTACQTLHTTNFYPGGFAQYVQVPQINVERGVYRLPQTMTFEEGTFIEPLACVSRGQRLSKLSSEDALLIIGGGLAGLLHLQLAKVKGLKNISVADINPYRLEIAKKLGAKKVIDARQNVPEQLKSENNNRLADQVFVCTGAIQAASTALECVDKGGNILFFAVPDPQVKLAVPITQFWRNEITIKTSYGAAPNDLDEALKLLTQKKIDVNTMITHRLGLLDAQEGFRLVSNGEKSLKVIIEPNRILS